MQCLQILQYKVLEKCIHFIQYIIGVGLPKCQKKSQFYHLRTVRTIHLHIAVHTVQEVVPMTITVILVIPVLILKTLKTLAIIHIPAQEVPLIIGITIILIVTTIVIIPNLIPNLVPTVPLNDHPCTLN